MKRQLVLAAAFLAVVSMVLAGKAWEKKPYTKWSKDDAFRVITDSPWGQRIVFQELATPTNAGPPVAQPSEGSHSAGASTIQRPSGGVQLRNRPSSVYTVSFLSSRVLRMAFARLAMLNGALDEQKAQQFVESDPFPGKIAVTVAVPGNQKESIFMELTTGDLQETTYLEFKKSKKKVYLENFLKPGEAGNDQAVFFFPREVDGVEVANLSEGEVKFVTRLGPDIALEQRFKLKKMVFDGKLEI